jgi:hypothetical protein
MTRRGSSFLLVACAALLSASGAAQAGSEMRAGGKLLLTNGVSTVDGSSGGGLATWSLIAGNETRDGIGGAVHATYAPLADYSLVSAGAAVGLYDRVELSYARESFDTQHMGAALGLGAGYRFHEDVLGAKLRVAGDAVYDQDSVLPQISIGVQYKHADRGAVIHAIGGAHSDGTDFTLSATKLFLRQSVIVGTSLRMTKANQFGLLGFGGDLHDRYTAQFEGSAGYLLTRRLVVGGEVRTKPDNLAFAKEQDAYDVFAAYAVTRNVSLTAAYVDLGSIATADDQRGAFLSFQASF